MIPLLAEIEPWHLWSAAGGVVVALATAAVFVAGKLVDLTKLFTSFGHSITDHDKRLEKVEARVERHHEALIRSGDLDMTGPHQAIVVPSAPGRNHR